MTTRTRDPHISHEADAIPAEALNEFGHKTQKWITT